MDFSMTLDVWVCRRAVGVVLMMTLSVVAIAATAPVSSDPLAQAERLLNEGRAREAYKLLEPDTEEWRGDTRFDYLYGLAALETGRYSEATFAFERVVTQDPAFAAARMELARAYFQMGAYDRAEREFRYLQANTPPPAAAKVIEEHLLAIAATRNTTPQRWIANANTSVGYDSNANSSTALSRFLGFNLTPASRKTPSGFFSAGVGAEWLRKFADAWVFNAAGFIEHRENFDAHFVDATTVGGSGIARYFADSWEAEFGLIAFWQDVAETPNSESLQFAAAWRTRVADRIRVGAEGRYGPIRFGEGLKSRDVDQLLLAGTAGFDIGDTGQGYLNGTLLFGTDDPTEPGSRYGRDFYGLRLQLGWTFSPTVLGEVSLGTVSSDYDSVFFPDVFNTPRQDDLLQSAAVVDWRFNDHWMLTHSVQFYDNATEVDIFAYDRFVTRLTLRRYWR